MNNPNRQKISEYLYLTGLFVMAGALPFSNFLMSVSQFVLLAGWIVGGNYREKTFRFLQNKTAVVFTLFYFLHLTGIAYASDLPAGFNDLRMKLPLLALPFIVAGMNSIPEKMFSSVLAFFLGSVFINTLTTSVNEEWLLISPIRFSMMVCFAGFILLHFFFMQNEKWKKITAVLLAAWFIIFLFKWKYETGVVTFAGALFFSGIYAACRVKNIFFKISLCLASFAVPVAAGVWIYCGFKNFYGNAASEKIIRDTATANGEPYEHRLDKKDMDNGHYLWLNIAWNEVETAWNERSELDFKGRDKKGNEMTMTLLRFLTSKGFKKDREGVYKLTDNEVKAIENGIANARFMNGMSLNDRLYETIWSLHHYRIGNSPQNNSVTQRFEFWKAGWRAFLESPIIGHGTGSVKAALDKQYEAIQTPLDKRHRLKTHNQYLATAVALGGMGLMILFLSFLFPFFNGENLSNYLFLVFLVIMLLAMLVEDTLETQAGVTFAAFFVSLLLFSRSKSA